jgi:hypothetical protein
VHQERRRLSRSRILKGAKLVVGSTSTLDCVVRNLTNVGARIEISSTAKLPAAVGLTFDGGRTIRKCQVVWRRVTETGLKFV